MKRLTFRPAVLMLALVFVFQLAACGKNQVSSPEETSDLMTETKSPDSSAVAETITSGLPDLDFYDQTVIVLGWSDADFDEFNAEGQTGDVFNDAKFSRNLKVEENLKVKMTYNRTVRGNVNNSSEFINHVDNVIKAGTHDYDIIAGYSQTMCTMSSRLMFSNLLDTEYLDFDTEWWPDNMIGEFTINNTLYLCTGDIAPTTLYMMYVMYFNKNLIVDNNMESPHALIENNEWTFDKFFSMCSGFYSDLNGDSKKDIGDQFGYISTNLHLDPWFYASGAKMVDKDNDGNLIVSDTLSSEKVISTIERLRTLLWSTSDGLISDFVTTSEDIKHILAFADDRVLFTTDAAFRSINYFVTADSLSFGIAPMPKYDKNQEDYVSLLRNIVTLFAIPYDCTDPDMISAVMQCYAFYSYTDITPAIFELSLKLKYSDEEADARVYDIIRRTITFDIGRYYSKVLIGQADFRTTVENNSGSWASSMKSRIIVLSSLLKKLQNSFEG